MSPEPTYRRHSGLRSACFYIDAFDGQVDADLRKRINGLDRLGDASGASSPV